MTYVKHGVVAFVAAMVACVLWILGEIALSIGDWQMNDIRESSAGGLGAVSVGVSESAVYIVPVVFTIVFVWRVLRARSHRH